MKKSIKIMFGASLALATVVSLASCGKKNTEADGFVEDKETYNVGVLQLVTHDALDRATQGFSDQINESTPSGKKVNITVKNPQAAQDALASMATNLVQNYDLVMGNATPAAKQLVSSAVNENKKNLPVLFTSVTDPVSAGLVTSMKNKKGTVTGTSDMNPVETQIEMIFDFDSTVDKIGFLYTKSEENSKVQCDLAEEYIKTYNSKNNKNVTTQTKTITDVSQIGAMAQALVDGGCDFIYIPTDNTMASSMGTITNVTNPARIPLMCGEESMVANGGTLTYSLDYYELGKQTGKMAADILFNGKKTSEIDCETADPSNLKFAYNAEVMSQFGLSFSNEFKTKYNVQLQQ